MNNLEVGEGEVGGGGGEGGEVGKLTWYLENQEGNWFLSLFRLGSDTGKLPKQMIGVFFSGYQTECFLTMAKPSSEYDNIQKHWYHFCCNCFVCCFLYISQETSIQSLLLDELLPGRLTRCKLPSE